MVQENKQGRSITNYVELSLITCCCSCQKLRRPYCCFARSFPINSPNLNHFPLFRNHTTRRSLVLQIVPRQPQLLKSVAVKFDFLNPEHQFYLENRMRADMSNRKCSPGLRQVVRDLLNTDNQTTDQHLCVSSPTNSLLVNIQITEDRVKSNKSGKPGSRY